MTGSAPLRTLFPLGTHKPHSENPESAGSRGISGCRCQCQEDCGPGGGKVLPGWRARPPPRTHAGQTRPRPMLEGEGVVRPQLERLLVEGRASVSGAEAPGGT